MTGRPITLTPRVQGEVCAALQRGAYLDTALSLAGVARRTGREWLRRGREAVATLEADPSAPLTDADKACMSFLHAVKKATATAEDHALTQLQAAEAWQARAWFLERRHPERWAKREYVQEQVTDRYDLDLVPDDTPDDEDTGER